MISADMCDNMTSCIDRDEMSNSTDEVLMDPEFEHPMLFILLVFFSVVTVGGNLLVRHLSSDSRDRGDRWRQILPSYVD